MAKPTLQTLPAELRNHIYELAFTSDQEEPIYFCSAAPPRKDLLLTCHQFYNEANQIYRAAYRHYWSSSHFEMPRFHNEMNDVDKGIIRNMHTEDIEHITHLVSTSRLLTSVSAMRFENGGWTVEKVREGDQTLKYVAEGTLFRDATRVSWEVWRNGVCTRSRAQNCTLGVVSLKTQIMHMLMIGWV